MLHVKTTNQYNRATGKPKLGVKFKQHTRRQIVTKDKFAINLRDIGIGLRGSGLVLHPDGIGCCCFSFLASKIFISRSFFSKSNNLCCIPLGVFSINFCRKVGADDEDGPEFSPMSFSGINFLCIGNSFAITTKVRSNQLTNSFSCGAEACAALEGGRTTADAARGWLGLAFFVCDKERKCHHHPPKNAILLNILYLYFF